MLTEDIFALGLGLQSPWKLKGQRFDMVKHPHELHLVIGADRGAQYPCPECGTLCKSHDFLDMSWRHLNFFQHLCVLTASVPRVDCPEHGIHRAKVPWARQGSGFTLLFEQVAGVCGVGLNETASKRGHSYVTIFIDMDRESRPVIFSCPGKGKECLKEFAKFLKQQGGNVDNVAVVVCDMSPAFIAAATEQFPNAAITVDWFHVVKLFTDAMDSVRRAEAKTKTLPKGTRWAILKGDKARTNEQQSAFIEFMSRGLHTATAFWVRELLRWVREADSKSAARWRANRFLAFTRKLIGEEVLLEPVGKALNSFDKHFSRILRHWDSLLSNARLEGMNGLFQAARARARGYRNQNNFIAMIYLIGAPIAQTLWP